MRVCEPYPLRVTVLYGIAGSLWIVGSDRLAAWLIANPHLLLQVETCKGWFFIAVTATMVYFELHRECGRVARTTAALRESEHRYQTLALVSPVGIFRTDPYGATTYVNPKWCEISGLSADEAQGDGWLRAVHPDDKVALIRGWRESAVQQKPSITDYRMVRPDGAVAWVMGQAVPETNSENQVIGYVGTITDISARKQAEETLRGNESKQRAMVANIADVIAIVDQDGVNRYKSPNIEKWFGWRPEDVVGTSVWENIHPDDVPDAERIFAGVLHECLATGLGECRYRCKDGGYKWIEYTAVNLLHDPDIRGVLLNYHDITERKEAEVLLRREQQFSKSLLDSLPGIFYLYTYPEHRLVLWNKQHETLLGYTPEEMKNRTVSEWHQPEVREAVMAAIDEVMVKGQSSLEASLVAKDGRLVPVLLTGVRFEAEDRRYYMGIGIDITDRKRAEERLRYSEAHLRALIDTLPDLVWLKDPDGVYLSCNRRFSGLYGAPEEDIVGKTDYDFVDRDVADSYRRRDAAAVTAGAPTTNEEELHFVDDGHTELAETIKTPIRASDGRLIGVLGVSRDISERKRSEDSLSRRVSELESLRIVDQAIVTSLDLPATLSVLLEQAMTQLQVDAAAVLLHQPELLSLEYAAWRGFHLRRMEDIVVPLGESFSGRVALHHRSVRVSAPIPEQDNAQIAALWADEQFIAYHGVPLFVQGEIKGVLEVYSRNPIADDPSWLDFLNALAGQAAIAIANAQLFDGMQRANEDLALAYNATIEGWSRAMDLRDQETEGHTQRVTELTMRLARAVGVGDSQLMHIWRGSLLHDMGKLGVPDHILLKPGELTDEESVIMRQHPQFAHDMLSPIAYLRPALDIPYCHHEKWDGTGYPRGLVGEQIPLAARLFAVVDVWDALTSDRPYRRAWPKAKVLAHIAEQSGKHFDPQAVQAFLKIA